MKTLREYIDLIESAQTVAEGISVIDQDYDLDQIVLTIDIEGKQVSFTYTDYEEDFENAERRDVFDQLQEQPWYKGLDHPTKMEILDAAYRAIRGLEPQEYRPTVGDEPLDEQGVAEGIVDTIRSKNYARLADRSADKRATALDNFDEPEHQKQTDIMKQRNLKSRLLNKKGVAEGSFAHDQLKGEINDLFKPVVLQIVKWARAEGMTAKDLAGTSSHFFLDALDPDTYDRTQHLPDNYFNKLMDKANAKAVEILNKEFQKSVKEDQLEETEVDPVRRIEELFNNK